MQGIYDKLSKYQLLKDTTPCRMKYVLVPAKTLNKQCFIFLHIVNLNLVNNQ
jgi:hypothetical protein